MFPSCVTNISDGGRQPGKRKGIYAAAVGVSHDLAECLAAGHIYLSRLVSEAGLSHDHGRFRAARHPSGTMGYRQPVRVRHAGGHTAH